jgi:S1-C subfamily serine protease
MKLLYILGILVLLMITGFSQTPQEVFKTFRPKICLVEFYKNISSQGQIGSYIKIKQRRIGIIVSRDGLVMVNSDVHPLSLDIISGEGASFASGEPSDFKVKMHDGKEYEAEFIGKDDLSQVAFISISGALNDSLPYVEFRSTDQVEIGQTIYVLELLGEEYHFDPLFSEYKVNAIVNTARKKFLVKDGVTALSAGGLVVSESNEAIGITLRREFGFNIDPVDEFAEYSTEFLEIGPSEWLTNLIQQPPVLEKTTHQGKAWFGIGMQALTPELKSYWEVPSEGGIVIDRVYPQSPAEKAGLKVKDVIITFDGKKIDIQRNEDLNRFRELITQQTPETTVNIEIFREGEIKGKKIKLTSAPRAIDLAEKYQLSELGVEVRELTLDILYDNDFPLDKKGVYVFQVDHAAPAGLAGLEMGSIITHVNGEPIEDLVGFEKKIQAILQTRPAKIMFQTQFNRQTQFVFLDGKY